MTDDLRTRIADVVYRHILFRALDQCECGAAFDGFCGRSLDAYAAHVADAVIAELGRRKCQRCRIAVPLDGFPMPHEGSDVMRPFCLSCTNYLGWATS